MNTYLKGILIGMNMNGLVNALVIVCVNGGLLVVGAVCLLIGCAGDGWSNRRCVARLLQLLHVLGFVLILLSGIPLPFWMYGILLGLWVGRMVLARRHSSLASRKMYRAVTVCLVGMTAWMVGAEWGYHRVPALASPSNKTVYVVGDSLSAMVDKGGMAWPELVGQKTGLAVHNCSANGATVKTALRNAAAIPNDVSLVLLEIGGNNLLAGTPIPEFETGLDALLKRVAGPDRTVAMVELPIPPLCNRYGMVQRTLAARYGVTLIPKKYLLDVIMASGATVDGLHLSNAGHAHMADSIVSLFRH